MRKHLVLISVAACFMAVFVTGCSTTARDANVSVQPPLFGVGGKLCAFGVCVSPEARIDATVPADVVIVQPTPTPPVVAVAQAPFYQPMPAARSYNDVPMPVRALEK